MQFSPDNLNKVGIALCRVGRLIQRMRHDSIAHPSRAIRSASCEAAMSRSPMQILSKRFQNVVSIPFKRNEVSGVPASISSNGRPLPIRTCESLKKS